MIPIEVELKWALTSTAHALLAERIATLLGPAATLHQENRFFDSVDGRLRQAKRSVRMRRENDRIILTCKCKGTVDAIGTHRHAEWESEMPADAWGHPPSGPLPDDWQADLAGAPLIALGGFSNLRLEWHDGLHLLCLDRTDLDGRIDHELEIETPEPEAANARWAALLREWGVGWTVQPVTKLQRWFALRNPR